MSTGTGCEASVDLYWIPLGSGGHVVRWNGMVYEALKAFAGHRERCALYHSALEVTTSDARYVIEVTPVPDHDGRDRGVVGEGPVGLRSLGRLRSFRYEIRRWRDGEIPDAGDRGTRVVRVADDAITAERVLASLPSVPKPVWGRDELATGGMWNSNSVVSWVLATAGVEVDGIPLPRRGRAPGWEAGLVVARRSPIGKTSLGSPAHAGAFGSHARIGLMRWQSSRIRCRLLGRSLGRW